jgi:hypothetical protein
LGIRTGAIALVIIGIVKLVEAGGVAESVTMIVNGEETSSTALVATVCLPEMIQLLCSTRPSGREEP